MPVGAFLRINTVVILLGVVIRGNPWVVQAEMEGVRFERSLWEPEILKVHEFFTERLYVEGKYAVKLSITEPSRLVGNEGNVIMVVYGKCKCGLTPIRAESGPGRIWNRDTGNRDRYNLTYILQTRNLRILGTFGGLI